MGGERSERGTDLRRAKKISGGVLQKQRGKYFPLYFLVIFLWMSLIIKYNNINVAAVIITPNNISMNGDEIIFNPFNTSSIFAPYLGFL